MIGVKVNAFPKDWKTAAILSVSQTGQALKRGKLEGMVTFLIPFSTLWKNNGDLAF
jgi:hypothetical protein